MLPYVKPPISRERLRMEAIVAARCVCCGQLSPIPAQDVPLKVECDHLISGNKRRGHRFTIPLCKWHHRGIALPDLTDAQMERRWGPSRAGGSRPFHERFGSDQALLRMADAAIGWADAAEPERERKSHTSWKCLPRNL